MGAGKLTEPSGGVIDLVHRPGGPGEHGLEDEEHHGEQYGEASEGMQQHLVDFVSGHWRCAVADARFIQQMQRGAVEVAQISGRWLAPFVIMRFFMICR